MRLSRGWWSGTGRDELNLTNIRARLVALCVVDEEGGSGCSAAARRM